MIIQVVSSPSPWPPFPFGASKLFSRRGNVGPPMFSGPGIWQGQGWPWKRPVTLRSFWFVDVNWWSFLVILRIWSQFRLVNPQLVSWLMTINLWKSYDWTTVSPDLGSQVAWFAASVHLMMNQARGCFRDSGSPASRGFRSYLNGSTKQMGSRNGSLPGKLMKWWCPTCEDQHQTPSVPWPLSLLNTHNTWLTISISCCNQSDVPNPTKLK